jgi:hypothetical protein
MNATEQYQRAFAAHVRDPANQPPPAGVDRQRMQVYTDLLFNNLDDVLGRTFPVLHSLLEHNRWRGLLRQFYAQHACQTPYFREIAGEFVQWLGTAQLPAGFPAFTLELAHYEWVEIPLLLDPTVTDWQAVDPEGELLDGQPVLNPVMLLQTYRYPVHQLGPDQPQEPCTTHLLLLRNRHGAVDFVVLNAVTARLLECLQEGLNGRQALMQVAGEISHPDTAQLLHYGRELLAQFREQDILVGIAYPH